MAQVGHARLGTHGEILSLDAGFCAILGTEPEAILGRSVLDVTVPADRGTCAALMRNLVATHEPFHVAKRYLRGDGSEIWVTNTVSIIQLGDDPPMLVSTIVPIDPPAPERDPVRDPRAMLDCARFMLSSRRDRGKAFATTMFAEPAWDMMLTAYVAEAERAALDLASLARAGFLPDEVATRWIKALMQEGLLEVESRSSGADAAAYRVTARAHRQFEDYLSGVLDKRPSATRSSSSIRPPRSRRG